MTQLKERLSFIMKNARSAALPQSFMSCILAVCIALKSPSFSLLNAILATIGVLAAHLSANLFDDIFDYLQGKVEIRNNTCVGRAKKCANIVEGRASLSDFVNWAVAFGVIAVLVGLYFVVTVGLEIFYFILIGALLIIFYSAPPIKLSYRGFGELVIGLMFGPLLVCGVYYVTTGMIDTLAILYSFATGLLATNIVYVHSMVDINIDNLCEKTTLAVLLKSKNNQMIALSIFTFVPYILVLCASLKLGLFLLLTLPIAFYLMIVLKDAKRHKILFRQLPKKSWKYIIKCGNDYFYTRWLLARNYMTIFVGIICLYYILEVVL